MSGGRQAFTDPIGTVCSPCWLAGPRHLTVKSPKIPCSSLLPGDHRKPTPTMVRACRPPARRERPIILTVDAAAMHAAGHAFYQAANGVWLTDHVPPGYLSGWPG